MADPRTGPAPEELFSGAPRKWTVTDDDPGERWSSDRAMSDPSPDAVTPRVPAWTAATDGESEAQAAEGEERANAAKYSSNLLLAAAGLAVFDAILSVAYVVFWTIDPSALLKLLQSASGFSLVAAVAPISAGGVLLRRHRKNYFRTPGGRWALAAILSGAVLAMLTLFLPFLGALSLMLNDV